MFQKVTHATILLQPGTRVKSRTWNHLSNALPSVGADAKSLDDAELWTTRVRVERGPDTARYVVEISDGRVFVLLLGEPQSLSVDDKSLESAGEEAAVDWMIHIRQPSKRRPLFPQRRFPSRRHQQLHSGERRGQVAA